MDMGDWAGAPDAGWKQEEDGVGDSQDGGMAIEESEGIPGRNGTDRIRLRAIKRRVGRFRRTCADHPPTASSNLTSRRLTSPF